MKKCHTLNQKKYFKLYVQNTEFCILRGNLLNLFLTHLLVNKYYNTTFAAITKARAH